MRVRRLRVDFFFQGPMGVPLPSYFTRALHVRIATAGP